LVFSREGLLFITQGDRFSYREQAQNLDVLIGKIVRVTRDGEVPRDNPFVGRAGARPEIWSYGHRNVQAAALDPATGQLWTVEHGAAGGDELNHPEAGKNYGWPVITYGRDYNGRSIGEGASKEGMEQPVYYWDPVIAPSGMIFYSGDKFPGWRGNILIGGLASQALVRLVLRDGRVTQEIRYLGELGQRIRDVQEGSDGFLYVVTDEDPGALLRLRPREGSALRFGEEEVRGHREGAVRKALGGSLEDTGGDRAAAVARHGIHILGEGDLVSFDLEIPDRACRGTPLRHDLKRGLPFLIGAPSDRQLQVPGRNRIGGVGPFPDSDQLLRDINRLGALGRKPGRGNRTKGQESQNRSPHRALQVGVGIPILDESPAHWFQPVDSAP
jgi:hypothetical protein